MLLKLLYPSSAPLVTLNFDSSIPKTDDVVTVIGYGRTEYDNSMSQSVSLLELDTVVNSDEYCDSWYMTGNAPPGAKIDPDYVPKTNVCAFTNDGAACLGDSGGPLLTADNVQIGITSYGPIACGEVSRPDVYTEVAAYEEFINKGICGKHSLRVNTFFQLFITNFLYDIFFKRLVVESS